MQRKLGTAAIALACLALLAAFGFPVQAANLPNLPVLALDPQPPTSIWNGLHVGTEIFVLSSKQPQGLVGGGVNAGYDHAFANNIVLGIEGSTGFLPGGGWGRHGSFKGFDYAAIDGRVGYDMGRLMPYLTGGVVLDKAHYGPGTGYQGSESFNNLFNEHGEMEAAGRVGAGVVYALTPDLHFSLGVSVTHGGGALLP